MAVKVPLYQQDVSLRPILQQDLEVRAKPEAFGWDVGQGVANLGKGMQQASNALVELDNFTSGLRAKDRQNELDRWDTERKYGPNGFMLLKGKAAVDGHDAYQKELEEKRAQLGAGLPPTAARLFSETANNTVLGSLRQGLIHRGQELKTWQAETAEARLGALADAALGAYQDPVALNSKILEGVGVIRETAALRGWDAEKLKAEESKFASGIHANTVTRLMQDSPSAALKYFENNQTRFSQTDAVALREKLKGAMHFEKVQRNVADVLGMTRDPGLPVPPAEQKTGDIPRPDFLAPEKTEPRRFGPATPAPAPANSVKEQGPTQLRAFLRSRLAPGKSPTNIDNLDPGFSSQLAALLQDFPEAEGKLGIRSGWRSLEEQTILWNRSDKTGRTVAEPGNSRHEHAGAVDLTWNGVTIKRKNGVPQRVIDMVHSLAKQRGLYFPMDYEPWHVEPVGSRRNGPRAADNPAVGTTPGATVTQDRPGPVGAMQRPSWLQIEQRLNQIKDPKERADTLKGIEQHFALRDKADEAVQTEAKLKIYKGVLDNQPVMSMDPNLLLRAGNEAVSTMLTLQDKMKGAKDVQTDERVLYDLRKRAAEDPDSFAKEDLFRYRPHLNGTAFDEVQKLQTSALTDARKAREEGLNLKEAYSMAETQLEALGITTKGKNPTRDADKFKSMSEEIAKFNNGLADEMANFKKVNGKVPTQMEVQAMINARLMKYAVTTPGKLYGTNTEIKPAFQLGTRPDDSTVAPVIKYEDITIDLRRGITTDLERELGRKPSKEEIVERYKKVVLDR